MDQRNLPESISAWLESIFDDEQDSRLSRKRKRSDPPPSSPLTPPRTLASISRRSVSPKRKKSSNAAENIRIRVDDQDPRPSRTRPRSLPDDESASLAPSSVQPSSASTRSSPTRRAIRLRIMSEGLRIEPLVSSSSELSREATRFLRRFKDIAAERRVLPAQMKHLLGPHTPIDDAYGLLLLRRLSDDLSRDDDDSEARLPSDLFSRDTGSTERTTPSTPASIWREVALLNEVDRIVKKAVDAQANNYDESEWNSQVHSAVLSAAFSRASTSSYIDYMACMNAPIIPRYLMQEPGFMIEGTKVDYTFVLSYGKHRRDVQPGSTRVTASEAATEATMKMMRHSDHNTVNHTSHASLVERPTCVPIETKRYSGDRKRAEEQLGVWTAAQWRVLVEQVATRAASVSAPMEPDSAELAEDNNITLSQLSVSEDTNGLSGLPFLPQLIVDGHEWRLTLSTFRNGRTTLWTSQEFGSTSTLLGTFQVLAGLEELIAWADGYRIWYESKVLGVRCNGPAA